MIDFFYKYRWVILIAFFCITGIYTAWFGFGLYDQRRRKAAEEQIYRYKSKLMQVEKKNNGNILDSSSNFYSQKRVEDISLFKKELDDYIQFLTSEKKFQTNHFISAVELAYFLTQYDKLDEALNLLDHISSKTESKDWIYQALLIKLGTLLIEKKHYTRAIYLFSIVLKNKKAQPFHLEALIKTAISYEALGKYNEAEKIYTTIKNEKNAGLYEQRAVNYRRLLKIKQKTGQPL